MEFVYLRPLSAYLRGHKIPPKLYANFISPAFEFRYQRQELSHCCGVAYPDKNVRYYSHFHPSISRVMDGLDGLPNPFLDLPQGPNIMAMYIWIDGTGQGLR